MDEAEWKRLSALLDELFDLDATQREARLQAIAGEDPSLADELRRLLAADERSGLLDHADTVAAPSRLAQLLRDAPVPEGPGTASGLRLGHYRLVERIGSGGMGEVWRAQRSDDFEQSVAIKLIRPLLDSPMLRERFARERRILARLDHPNIARLLDGGVSEDGTPWYAMEYVRGEPLLEHANRNGLDLRGRVRLLLQVCDAVAHAHAQLVVHRDLKPSNLLVDAEGRVRVLDFGIARLLDDSMDAQLTGTGVRVFSPAYAAPEQIRGEPVGTAADVFALGGLLFELLTGCTPFPRRSSSPDLLLAQLADEGTPVPSATLRERARADKGSATASLGIPGTDLDTIVATAMQPEPARRYAGAVQLGEDLRRWLEGHPIAARSDSRAYRMRKFVGRHRLAIGSASTVLLALLAGLGIALWQAGVARDQAARAEQATLRAEDQAAAARAEVQRTRRVKDFFIGSLGQADPLRRSSSGPQTIDEAVDAAIERADAELADDPVLQAAVLEDFGAIRTGQGRFEDAEALLQRSLALAEAQHGPDHPAVASVLLHLAEVSGARGDRLAGAPLIERAVALLERNDGGDPTRLADGLSALAAVQQQQGDPVAMRDSIERAATIFREHAPEDTRLLMALSNLATVDLGSGRLEQAEAGFREAMERAEAKLGPNTPHLWPNLFSMGSLAYMRGDLEAEAAFNQRALEVARHNYPEDHPWVAQSLSEVGWIHAREGRLAEGEPLMREGIAMYRRLDSPNVITSQRRLAVAMQHHKKNDEAIAELGAAWKTCEDRGLARHQTCLVIRANRAHMMALAGQAEEALAEAQAAASVLRELGQGSGLVSEVGQAEQAQAAALAALGRREEAFALQDAVIASYTAEFGAGHQETTSAISARKRLESVPLPD